MSQKLLDQLNQRKKEREEKEAKEKLKAQLRAKLTLKKEEEMIKRLEEERARKEALKEEQERLAEELKQKEIERKTKNFFHYNEFNRKIIPPLEPFYFGEHVTFGSNSRMNPAWLPQGHGEFHLSEDTFDSDGDRLYINGVTRVSGNFEKGVLHGNAYLKFKESEYRGEVKKGKLHGSGILTENGVEREALLRNELVICYKDGKDFSPI